MNSGMLSQEEIDALMAAGSQGESSSMPETSNQKILNEMETDAIGEIGNISMGTAATTLFTLLGHKVQITTPKVTETTIGGIASSFPLPFVAVQVNYTVGVKGMNLLILKEDDVKIITSLMLGGDGKSDIPEDLNDIHLSAISEAMNQMIGSSSTSLSEMLGKKIDISPPIVSKVNITENQLDPDLISIDETIICISFRMTIGDLIDSSIMQILPVQFAKDLVYGMMSGSSPDTPEPQNEAPPIAPSVDIPEKIVIQEEYFQEPTQVKQEPNHERELFYEEPTRKQPETNINIKPVSFENFEAIPRQGGNLPENIDLIKDVLLKVTVELGRTTKAIDEVLQFSPGSILELDKLVGEPLDIMVNGKKIAKGEVVVIDENYGIRITDIIKADKRLKSI